MRLVPVSAIQSLCPLACRRRPTGARAFICFVVEQPHNTLALQHSPQLLAPPACPCPPCLQTWTDRCARPWPAARGSTLWTERRWRRCAPTPSSRRWVLHARAWALVVRGTLLIAHMEGSFELCAVHAFGAHVCKAFLLAGPWRDAQLSDAPRTPSCTLQSLCSVCSVDLCAVQGIAAGIEPQPLVIDLNPHVRGRKLPGSRWALVGRQSLGCEHVQHSCCTVACSATTGAPSLKAPSPPQPGHSPWLLARS